MSTRVRVAIQAGVVVGGWLAGIAAPLLAGAAALLALALAAPLAATALPVLRLMRHVRRTTF